MNKTKLLKIISIILIISLALTAFTTNISATNTNSKNVWDGTTLVPKGEGTQQSPFLISNGAELAYVISTGGGAGNHYKLTADIYLNEIDRVNWATGEGIAGYSPLPWYDSVEFQGNINGNGHIVYGIYYNAGLDTTEMAEGWSTPVGLIPCIKNGAAVTVEKLGVDNMYINAKCTASAFIGRAGNSSATTAESRTTIYIDKCFVGGNVDVTAFCTGVFRGYSRNNGIYISNSYNLGKFRSNADKKNDIDGGTYDYRFSWFVGNTWGLNDELYIDCCFNATGALFKGHWNTFKTKITNCYAAGFTNDKNGDGVAESVWYSVAGDVPLPKERMQGIDALVGVQKMPAINTNNEYIATEGYPILKAFSGEEYDDMVEISKVDIWDGSVAETLSGEGTKASPYLITNGSELAYAIISGGADKLYKLTNDIYLNDINKINWKTGEAQPGYTPNSWFENIPFKGAIDGGGHIVYGLYYKTPEANSDWGYYGAGLVPTVNAGETLIITALGIENAFISGVNGASAFVGFAGQKEAQSRANVIVDKCFAGGNVTLIGHDVGALRGGTYNAKTTITNSYSLATLKGTSTNGLLGNLWDATVVAENCFNANGAVTTDTYLWPDVAENFKNVYATSAANYTSEVAELTRLQMYGLTAAATMSLPDNIFVSVENRVPQLKDFFKYSEDKNGKDYIGYEYSGFCKYFTTVSADAHFWRYDDIDINGDRSTNICDLVFVTRRHNSGKNTIHLDSDNETTSFDISILRKALIGDTDYENKPIRFTPYNNITNKYDYVWGDEFEENYLNSDKWSIYPKMGSNPSGGFICDKDEKVIGVENGRLRLTAYKDDEGIYHAPTSVVTRDTMNFTYGYVEIRAKLSLQTGVWSSFWALTVSDSASIGRLATPKCENTAEVDMFEVFNTNQVCGGIIKWAENEWYPKSKDGLQRVVLTDKEYHVFGYEWSPSEIAMYCDGVLYARFDITENWTNPGEYGKAKEGWTYYNVDETGYDMSCFNDPQYLIFNNHLFYEGVSNANPYINISNPYFKSADYLIDYCRVYQKPGVGDIVTK